MTKFFRRGSRSSMVVLGGSSHPELTAKIARRVGVKQGRVELGKFKNGETKVQLNENVREKDIYILQTGGVHSNDAVVELLLLINACKLASAASITLITPYYPYSKSDQKSSVRSPIASKLVANMIQSAGAEHIMMLDPHSPQLVGFFDIPVDSLKVEPLFCTWIKHNIPDWRQYTVVAPDEGGAKRSTMIANYLELDFAMIHNRYKKSLNARKISRECMERSPSPTHRMERSPSPPHHMDFMDSDVTEESDTEKDCLRLTNNIMEKMLKISGDVKDKNCIVVDDMIDTGSTIRLALEILHSHGARKVYVFAAHGIFSGDSIQILNESEILQKVIVTNSIPQVESKNLLGELLDVVDISGIISEYIRRCHYNESVSVLTDVGSEFDTKDELLQSLVRAETGRPAGDQVRRGGRLGQVRKGYRLESVCWDN